MPPTDEDLPKPAPALVWQQGKDKWHVDAPVAVVGDRSWSRRPSSTRKRSATAPCSASTPRPASMMWRTPLKRQPVGRPVGVGQDGRRQRQHDRLRPRGAQGAPGATSPPSTWRRARRSGSKEITGGVVVLRRPDRRTLAVVTAPTARCGPSTWPPASAAGSTTARRRSSPRRRVGRRRGLRRRPQGRRPRHQPQVRRRRSGSSTWRRPGRQGAGHGLRRPGASTAAGSTSPPATSQAPASTSRPRSSASATSDREDRRHERDRRIPARRGSWRLRRWPPSCRALPSTSRRRPRRPPA